MLGGNNNVTLFSIICVTLKRTILEVSVLSVHKYISQRLLRIHSKRCLQLLQTVFVLIQHEAEKQRFWCSFSFWSCSKAFNKDLNIHTIQQIHSCYTANSIQPFASTKEVPHMLFIDMCSLDNIWNYINKL